MRVGSFLDRAEDALSKLTLQPAMLKITPTSPPPDVIDVGSGEDLGVWLFLSSCCGQFAIVIRLALCSVYH
jgi:hypothetical protein